jgi:hypothetical protein
MVLMQRSTKHNKIISHPNLINIAIQIIALHLNNNVHNNNNNNTYNNDNNNIIYIYIIIYLI